MRCDDMRRRRARTHACNTRGPYDDAGVCREWRCKYEGDKATSASLEACSKVLDEYLPELKKIDGVTVNRAVAACESQLSRNMGSSPVGVVAFARWRDAVDGRGATPGGSTSSPSKRCRRRDAHR